MSKASELDERGQQAWYRPLNAVGVEDSRVSSVSAAMLAGVTFALIGTVMSVIFGAVSEGCLT